MGKMIRHFNPKRKNKTDMLKCYPFVASNSQSSLCEDSASISSHLKAIDEEMKKAKPRDQLLLPLMKSTFTVRRDFVQNQANNVKEILEKYTALNHPAVIVTIVSGDNPASASLGGLN
jgi:hypothetical protein